MSDSEEELKIVDKRKFTSDGELRNEFRDLESVPKEPTRAEERGETETRPTAEPRDEEVAGTAQREAQEGFFEGGQSVAPSFVELIGILAEPIAVYLGDAPLPDGRSVENLDLARLHIDLLGILQEKTKGNLSEEEAALLENLLYQLRLRYVQKKG